MNTFRAGNIVRIKYDYGQEKVYITEETIDSPKISGLPVSISALEDIGFISTVFSDHTEIMRDIDDFLIKYNPDKKLNFTIQYFGETIAEVSIQFIHQLQNIFFDLSGLCLT